MSTHSSRSLSSSRAQKGINESYLEWGKNLYRDELAKYTNPARSGWIPAAAVADRMRRELPADNDRVFAVLFGLLQEPEFMQAQLEHAGREIARPKVNAMCRAGQSIQTIAGEIQKGLHLKSQKVAKHIVVDIAREVVNEDRAAARAAEQARRQQASRNQRAYTPKQPSGPGQYGKGGPAQGPSHPTHGSSSFGYSLNGSSASYGYSLNRTQGGYGRRVRQSSHIQIG